MQQPPVPENPVPDGHHVPVQQEANSADCAHTAATSDGQPPIVQGYGPPSSTGPFNRRSPSTHNPPPFAALALQNVNEF
jgi:hypothetical protein